MPLINLTTNLKSLKFGVGTASDRPGGGYSNQPYIIKDIPSDSSDPSNVFNTGGPDSLLRGGLMAPIKAINDVSRLTQMFFDTRTPNGFLFIAKQNLLSRTSVKTEASLGSGTFRGKINQGVYLPTSTILQAGTGFLGAHGNLLGLNPLSPGNNDPSLSDQKSNAGLVRYESVIAEQVPDDYEEKNRLVSLVNSIKTNTAPFPINRVTLNGNNGTSIMQYGGGPGSILGIGNTNIQFADQRTGLKNPLAVSNKNYFFKGGGKTTNTSYASSINPISNESILIRGASNKYNTPLLGINQINNDFTQGDGFNVYENNGKSWPTTSPLQYKNNSSTYNQEQIISEVNDVSKLTGNPIIKDFRKTLIDDGSNNSTFLSIAPGYSGNKAIDQRVLRGNPGKRNSSNSYTIGNGVALDKINELAPYSNTSPNHTEHNDLVKFSIGILNNNGNGRSTYIHFRSFINSFDDSYNADWGETQYVGRGDKFYNYKGFNRSISMGWTTYAQSREELIPMYKKLNYLASSLAPDYSSGGFMKGNLARLTVGGYLYNQLGIIKSITYTIPQESTWEVAIDDFGNSTDSLDAAGGNTQVRELAHMINVTGFTFIPIEDTLPKIGSQFIALRNSGGVVRNYKNPLQYSDEFIDPESLSDLETEIGNEQAASILEDILNG